MLRYLFFHKYKRDWETKMCVVCGEDGQSWEFSSTTCETLFAGRDRPHNVWKLKFKAGIFVSSERDKKETITIFCKKVIGKKIEIFVLCILCWNFFFSYKKQNQKSLRKMCAFGNFMCKKWIFTWETEIESTITSWRVSETCEGRLEWTRSDRRSSRISVKNFF